MSLARQVVIACVLLLALAGGGLWHFRGEPESRAEAAVGRGGPGAAPGEVVLAGAGTVCPSST